MAIRRTIETNAERGSRRETERFSLNLSVLAEDGATGSPVLVHNLSTSGLLIETEAALDIGRQLQIALPEIGDTIATVVWNSERLFGCRFDVPLSRSALSAARLRNPLPADFDPARTELPAGIALGLRIRALREARRMSLSALARHAGISKPSLWAWENGKSTPRSKNLQAVADALHVPIEEILRQPASIPQENGGTEDLAAGAAGETNLHAEVEVSRKRVAKAAGVSPGKVRIIIEL